jgi:NAD(P)-dependent dehydrogenase (short-subunit alcohol dehydrogenase family)
MSSEDKILGRAAVITGGASGIGLATAKALAQRGARVLLADIEQDSLVSAAAEVAAAGAPQVEVAQCDVADLESMQALAEKAFATLGEVHILFNNAGVALSGPMLEMSHDDWRWIIDVDLWGAIHGVEAFVSRMCEQGAGGHVLFTASFAGLVPNVGLGAYCVAKYGVVALAEVLRREVREHGIGVSVLCPMRVSTNINTSQRNRVESYGTVDEAPLEEPVNPPDADNMAGAVLEVDDVARQVIAAIDANQLYVLPHAESREYIQRRFARIDASFEAK